jgi:hypothetical protein
MRVSILSFLIKYLSKYSCTIADTLFQAGLNLLPFCMALSWYLSSLKVRVCYQNINYINWYRLDLTTQEKNWVHLV